MDTIILQHQYGDCTHAVIVRMGDEFIISYGLWEPGKKLIATKERTYLNSTDHPELKDVHDGHGWNIVALQQLMMGVEQSS